jgi:molybdopterin-binding protein
MTVGQKAINLIKLKVGKEVAAVVPGVVVTPSQTRSL